MDNLSVKGLLLHLGLPDSGLTSLVWLVLALSLGRSGVSTSSPAS